MRSALATVANRRAARSRATSLSALPPPESSGDYIPALAATAASILYRSPRPSAEGRPVYVLNAAAFPDAWEVDYDTLLSYVLARLPGEEELIGGTEYEIVFFAGGPPEGPTSEKKQGPGLGWYLQAYHVLSRAMRKKLQRLYIVHPRTWVRVLIGVFGTIVSPKFRRKIIHVNTLGQLALLIPIERLLIPPTVYLHDRKLSPEIDVPYASGRRAFGARHPLPKSLRTGRTRLPRVLRETTSFILQPGNVGTEGLFRIPPHSVLASVLKEAYDRGQQWLVWKEREAVFVQPGIAQDLVDEVRLEDAYGVHLAASLIKQWYRDLRSPIFPDSSYTALTDKLGSPDAKVQPEDLVDLIMPASPTSPLSTTSREILVRHLLPLCSAVAAHEASNKMSADNLAILFSMCLVCGSNQLEDARLASTVIRKILEAAISMWPQLREGLGIDAHALEADLQPPSDMREYEDPLEDERTVEIRTLDEDARRITMDDDDEKEPEPKRVAPPLPTRKPIFLTTPTEPNVEQRHAASECVPTLPPRRPRTHSLPKPAPTQAAATMAPLPTLEVTSSPVKRKPAPGAAAGVIQVTANNNDHGLADPPRYSAMFDVDGSSIRTDDSPTEYSAAAIPGSGKPFVPDDKKVQPDTEAFPDLEVTKQRALPNTLDQTPVAEERPSSSNKRVRAAARSVSDGSKAARAAAQKAAEVFTSRVHMSRSVSSSASTTTSSPANGSRGGPDVPSPAEIAQKQMEEDVFRRPTWPASAIPSRQNSGYAGGSGSTGHGTSLPGLAKPVLPPQPAVAYPGLSAAMGTMAGPKPRTPSPGLLRRMESMEASSNGGVATWNGGDGRAVERVGWDGRRSGEKGLEAPKRLNLKKASVDDLRRLYEERVSLAEGLGRAGSRGQ